MSTGLTFGSISALFGLTNGYIDQAQYAVLVTTVILSAVVPTLIATTFFEPRVREAIEAEEIEAAEEIDAGPIPHPAVSIEREWARRSPRLSPGGSRERRDCRPRPLDGHALGGAGRGGE